MLTSDEERAIRHDIDLIEFRVDLFGDADGEDDFDEPAKVLNATFSLKAKGFHRYVRVGPLTAKQSANFRMPKPAPSRSMVRLLVHFVVDVARGTRHHSDMPKLLCDGGIYPDEQYLGSVLNTAPACGLYLTKVEYEHADSNFL